MGAELSKNPLWRVLVETVKVLPMYENHKHYVQDFILKENPSIQAKDLATLISIPEGEAMVLLEELTGGRDQPMLSQSEIKAKVERRLTDWSG